MSENIRTFEDLEAYKACREFRIFCNTVIAQKLIAQKEFDLTNQLKRSARSITANIAEGYGRFHYLDNSKFCSNARGSHYESIEHLITANDESLISNNDLQQARELFEKAIKPLNGYITYLLRSAENSK